MEIGTTKADITPEIGIHLAGYGNGRVSDSIDHSLRAECLVVRTGGSAFCLMSADLIGFAREYTESIRQGIAARCGLQPSQIMIAGTHTHSAPSVLQAGWNENHPDQGYFDSLEKTLIDTAAQAWENCCEGELLYGETQAPELGSNRRIQNSAGEWTNEWTDPEGTHTGYFDATVSLLGVKRPSGKLEALLVNYGNHPVCFGPESFRISGDYVSWLKDALEDAGDVGTVLFTVSGHGNINPRLCVQTDTEVTRKMGEDLAAIVRKALPHMTQVAVGPIRACHRNWTFERSCEIENKLLKFLFRRDQKGEAFNTELTAFGMADLGFVGIPGELVSEYMAMIKERSPFKNTIIMSMVNDNIGYITTDEILREGAYEAKMTPKSPMSEDLLHEVTATLKGTCP